MHDQVEITLQVEERPGFHCIRLDEPEAVVRHREVDIGQAAHRQIVDPDHGMAFIEQQFEKIRAQETRHPGYEYVLNRYLIVFY